MDPLVGPIIMLGAGGIMAEVNRDFSVRLAPTTVLDAYDMISEVRAARLISGFRNLPRRDLAAIVDCIVRFSKLALLDDPCIEEAEINPLLVRKDWVGEVDVRLRVGASTEEGRAGKEGEVRGG